MLTHRGTVTTRVLGVLAAAGLLVTAYIHAHLAGTYDAVGDQITQGQLFRAQAVAAVVAAGWLLLRPSRAAWLLAAAVAGASLLAVVGTKYVPLPALGPFPRIYEPVWYREKALAAVAAGIALLLSLLSVLRATPRTGVRRRRAAQV